MLVLIKEAPSLKLVKALVEIGARNIDPLGGRDRRAGKAVVFKKLGVGFRQKHMPPGLAFVTNVGLGSGVPGVEARRYASLKG